jgi:hypothetical protein
MYQLTLDDRVVQLHDIARQVEREVGKGAVSEDIRQAADRLNDLLKTVSLTQES